MNQRETAFADINARASAKSTRPVTHGRNAMSAARWNGSKTPRS